MQKIKSFKFGGLLNIIKCSLIGIVATLLGTVIFAFVLKFANLSSAIISYINLIIKAFAIFIMMTCVKRSGADKLFLKAILAGLVYGLMVFVVFSILNGKFIFDLSFLYDLLFSVIVSMIVAVIINILNRKNA